MKREHPALKYYPPNAPYESPTHQFILAQMRANQRPEENALDYQASELGLADLDSVALDSLVADLEADRQELITQLGATTAKLHALTTYSSSGSV